MPEIVGACLSQFHDDENSFELLLAFSDGREIGHAVSREAAQRIAVEFANEFPAAPSLAGGIPPVQQTAGPAAAYTIDYTGCDHMSRDIANIERIAAAGSKGPTPVVYLYEGIPPVQQMCVAGTPSYAAAEAAFTEYFVRNYPGPDTIIFDPKWHAPKLFAAAAKAMEASRGR